MRYKDIVIERKKRAAKEADAGARKSERGRKRRGPATVNAQAKKARRSKIELSEAEILFSFEQSWWCRQPYILPSMSHMAME
jgi:hypothetical protein